MDYYLPFLGPKAISIVVEPQGALTCRSSTLIDLADSRLFRALFWGPGEVSTINEPWGAFTIWSSTLADLANSGPFHGLLLIVLGSSVISAINDHGLRLRVGQQHL